MENLHLYTGNDFVAYMRHYLYPTQRGERVYALERLVYASDQFEWWAQRQAIQTTGDVRKKWQRRRSICAKLASVKYDKTHGRINRAAMLCQAARILNAEN